jgi:5-methylcytosine-specific restriction endonuclease McrA
MRRTKMRARRAEPRQRLAPRWTIEEWQHATMVLLTRCGSRCERCGRDLGNQLERHHRQRREVGGDRLSNLMALHSACHQQITEHPEEAREHGWIVSANGPIGGAPNPELVPVRLPDGYLWMLFDDGTKHPAA